MHSDHLGWILTCPSNLGTGLRAGCMVKLPLFSARPDFKTILGKMGLQARGCGGVDSDSVGGTWDVSNADSLVQFHSLESYKISHEEKKTLSEKLNNLKDLANPKLNWLIFSLKVWQQLSNSNRN